MYKICNVGCESYGKFSIYANKIGEGYVFTTVCLAVFIKLPQIPYPEHFLGSVIVE